MQTATPACYTDVLRSVEDYLMSAIRADKEEQLRQRMNELGIREEDIREHFVRGSGKGGQKVQKTSSCVQLRHEPSGLEVRCEKTRSQVLNRYHARVLLCEKIAEKVHGERSARAQAQEKVRRQKQRRSRKQKAKIREEKEHTAKRKQLRKSPKTSEEY